MNIEKTGKYIAACRKEKGFTQADLAEKLYVTDKAVSKWERGLSLPDIALLEPLTELLGISITELFQGESSSQSNVSKEIADQLIADSSQTYANCTRRKSKRMIEALLAILICIALFVPIAFDYYHTQKKITDISITYHAACENIVMLYDELTDSERKTVTNLEEEAYQNAMFYAGSASALLRSGKTLMQDYPQLYTDSEKLEKTVYELYESLCAAHEKERSYEIHGLKYAQQVTRLYREYHSFVESFEKIRKTASISGEKAF